MQAGADVTDGVKEAVLLSAMAGDADAKHRMIEIFLPQVAEIAKLYAGQGVFLEDLIGEGNVALTMAAEMLDCAQNAKEAEGTIASMIMEAMENYISENASEKKTGEMLAEMPMIFWKSGGTVKGARPQGDGGRAVRRNRNFGRKIRDAARITADHIEFLEPEG